MRMNRILIGALSAASYSDRRKWCRDTWFSLAQKHLAGAVFLIGDGEQPSFSVDGMLTMPCSDDYSRLPQKTRAFCQWALTQPGWDYLLKCDDDTALSIARLATYGLAGRDYIGARWRPGVEYGSGGAGYLLSRRATKIVAERLTAKEGSEDLLVGSLLLSLGVKLSIESRLVPWGNMNKRPMPGNDLISAHAVQGDVFDAIHREVDLPFFAELAAE